MTLNVEMQFHLKLAVEGPKLGGIYEEIRTKDDLDIYVDGIWSIQASKMSIMLAQAKHIQ